VIKKTLEMASSLAEEAELYWVESKSNEILFEANRLKSIDSSFEEGIGLRIIKQGKIGFSSSTELTEPQRLVKAASESAKFGEKAHFHFPSGNKVSSVECYDESLISLSLEQMIEEGEKTINLILKEAPSLQCEGEIAKTETEINILNTNGLSHSYKKTSYTFYLGVFLAEEGNFLSIGEGEASVKYQEWSSSIAQRIIEAFRLAKKKEKISPGRHPVIFTSKAVPLLLQSLKRGINGKMIQKKASPLLGKIGKPIISSSIDIFDDALFPFALATSPMDGEGMPSCRTQIIQQGVLKNFIYDLQTAGLMGTKSTSNGARGYDTLPSPSTSNFIIKEGKVSLEEMVKDIKEGIIVDQVIGSGQGNVLMGEFSVNLDLGYKVERGKIKGRIKDVMISGNSYTMLNNVLALGSESRFIGSTSTPPIYFKEINVAG